MAGVRKLSDATGALLVEFSANVNTNNGSFYISAPEGAAATYGTRTKGTGFSTGYNHATFAAPITNVIAASYNNSGSGGTPANCVQARINGTAVTGPDAGTNTTAANYGNHPIYIGRRGGSSLPFNGILYTLIIRGTTTTTGTIADFERNLLARRCGVTF